MASFITQDVLGLRKGTTVGRLSVVVLAFVYTSVFHHYTDVATGNSWLRIGAFQFFMMQILGMFIEDFVRGAWQVLDSGSRDQPVRASLATRSLGFLWVLLWLTVSFPGSDVRNIADETNKVDGARLVLHHRRGQWSGDHEQDCTLQYHQTVERTRFVTTSGAEPSGEI